MSSITLSFVIALTKATKLRWLTWSTPAAAAAAAETVPLASATVAGRVPPVNMCSNPNIPVRLQAIFGSKHASSTHDLHSRASRVLCC
jgi:hypothetical protein